LGWSCAHCRRHKPTSLGLPRSTLVRCDWRRCALYSGVGCLAAGQLSVPAPDPILPSLLATIPAIRIHEASSSVHSRSPIQSFPNLDCADGSHAPSALPRASHLAVTSNARRDREQVMRHLPGSRSAGNPPFSSRSTTTHPVRLRVARQTIRYLPSLQAIQPGLTKIGVKCVQGFGDHYKKLTMP
jgi:hypothetical protein